MKVAVKMNLVNNKNMKTDLENFKEWLKTANVSYEETNINNFTSIKIDFEKTQKDNYGKSNLNLLFRKTTIFNPAGLLVGLA